MLRLPATGMFTETSPPLDCLSACLCSVDHHRCAYARLCRPASTRACPSPTPITGTRRTPAWGHHRCHIATTITTTNANASHTYTTRRNWPNSCGQVARGSNHRSAAGGGKARPVTTTRRFWCGRLCGEPQVATMVLSTRRGTSAVGHTVDKFLTVYADGNRWSARWPRRALRFYGRSTCTSAPIARSTAVHVHF